MAKNYLYIIGNGFDIHHGVASRYKDFGDYLQAKDSSLYTSLEKYFRFEDLWADFERALADIDVDMILEHASEYLVGYGASDWSEADNHNYQYEIQQATELVTVKLKEIFTAWILQLENPLGQSVYLPRTASFLTFNYTNFLESDYAIPGNQILYIHGKAIDPSSDLILGHGRDPSRSSSYSDTTGEETDFREAEGYQIIDNYFKETFKDTESIIQQNGSYFGELSKKDEVYVLGCSLSEIDIKYFKSIAEAVPSTVDWIVSYYGDKEANHHLNALKSIGLDQKKIKLIKMDDLNHPGQLSLF